MTIIRNVPILDIGEKFSANDADQAIAALGELDFEPALAVGAASEGAPAFGVVKRLHRSAGKLLADFEVSHPSIVEALRGRKFKSIIAEMYHGLKRSGRQFARALKMVRLEGVPAPAVQALVPAGVVQLSGASFDAVRIYSMPNEPPEDASQAFLLAVEQLQRERQIPFIAAWDRVAVEQPALLQAYEAEQSRRARASLPKPTGHESEYFSQGGSAGHEVVRRAQQRVRDGLAKNYAEAEGHVLEADPELKQRYHEESAR